MAAGRLPERRTDLALNILLLEEAEVGALIPRADRRWAHVKKVLKKVPGDRIEAGIACDADSVGVGALGQAVLRSLGEEGLVLDFEPERDAPPLAPLTMVLGFPRPIQASRILKDLTSLGVSEIHLTGTELGEKSYAQSSIFKDREFRGPLIEGAEQSGNPRLPRVFTHWSLARCLKALAEGGEGGAGGRGSRIFLHPYGEPLRMGAGIGLEAPVTLAIGSERGWTEAEIGLFRASGFAARGLGDRILKTETAALAATVLALAGLGLL
jgi:16S rRNA (uracil1498-N3)-methyltransferase